jgi:hypothetical protein
MRENASVVASLLTLSHSFVIQVFIAVAWQQTWRGDARIVTALLGSARRKHSFVYCCVIAGACFDVTVLAWSSLNTPQYHDNALCHTEIPIKRFLAKSLSWGI